MELLSPLFKLGMDYDAFAQQDSIVCLLSCNTIFPNIEEIVCKEILKILSKDTLTKQEEHFSFMLLAQEEFVIYVCNFHDFYER
jgi:hypothetical protein